MAERVEYGKYVQYDSLPSLGPPPPASRCAAPPYDNDDDNNNDNDDTNNDNDYDNDNNDNTNNNDNDNDINNNDNNNNHNYYNNHNNDNSNNIINNDNDNTHINKMINNPASRSAAPPCSLSLISTIPDTYSDTYHHKVNLGRTPIFDLRPRRTKNLLLRSSLSQNEEPLFFYFRSSTPKTEDLPSSLLSLSLLRFVDS